MAKYLLTILDRAGCTVRHANIKGTLDQAIKEAATKLEAEKAHAAILRTLKARTVWVGQRDGNTRKA